MPSRSPGSSRAYPSHRLQTQRGGGAGPDQRWRAEGHLVPGRDHRLGIPIFYPVGHKFVHVPEHFLREYDRLLMGGIWAQIDIRHQYDEEAKGKRSPFWIDSLKPIQDAKGGGYNPQNLL
jgi:hypothetical protein